MGGGTKNSSKMFVKSSPARILVAVCRLIENTVYHLKKLFRLGCPFSNSEKTRTEIMCNFQCCLRKATSTTRVGLSGANW